MQHRFEGRPGDSTFANRDEIVSESGLELLKPIMGHIETDAPAKLALLMGEREVNDRFRSDHSVAADLPLEADVERECPQPVVAVGDADEGAISSREP
jgi:hypothetical protein